MLLRAATLTDLPVLRRWDADPDVIASSGDDGPWDWEAEIAEVVDWREILIGEEDGRPVGVVQIIDPDREATRYWGETGPGFRAIDIWIGEAADRGRGLGAGMMRLALARCFAAPEVRAVLIDPLASNTRAHGFYRRCGFRPVGRRVFGTDDCLVHRLDRADWEAGRA